MRVLDRAVIRCGITLCIACLITVLCAKYFRTDNIQVEIAAESPQIINYQLVYHGAESAAGKESVVSRTNRYIRQPELLPFVIPAKQIDYLALRWGNDGLPDSAVIHEIRINNKVVPLSAILTADSGTQTMKLTGEQLQVKQGTASLVILPAGTGVYEAQRQYQWLPLVSMFFIAVLAVWTVLFVYLPRFYDSVGGQKGRTEQKRLPFCFCWLSFWCIPPRALI